MEEVLRKLIDIQNELKEIKISNKEVRKENEKLREEIRKYQKIREEEAKKLNIKMKALEERIDFLEEEKERSEKIEKKNNLIITEKVANKGNQEERRRGVRKRVEDLLKHVTEKEIPIQNVKLIAMNSKGRDIIAVKLQHFDDKMIVLKKKGKLRGSDIYIDNDLTKKEAATQMKIRQRVREERSKGNRAQEGYQKIAINGVWKKWEEAQQFRMRIQPEDSHINDIKENVKVIFWNVAGIMNKGNDFWTFIEKFDVVNLLETWVEENTWKKIKGKLPRNWNWKCTFATRTCKKGRAKGGIITGIKKLFKEQEGGINTENIQERKLIIDESKWRIIAVYNPEGGEGVWQDLKHKLEDYEEENLLIGGDFNCRTGILGTWKDGEDMWVQRNSKDKTVNKQGRYLIKEIEDRGWYILNGAIKGDEEGNFTYIGERGETVIDYVIVNEFSN